MYAASILRSAFIVSDWRYNLIRFRGISIT